MNDAIGWAVRSSDGTIKVRTVSETRRAAIVNFLVTDCGTMVFANQTDEQIEAMWEHHGKYCDVRPVRISS